MKNPNSNLQNLQTMKTVEQIVDGLTLFDDDLMSMVFDNNIKATELMLRVILGQDDLKVVSVVGQRELKNPVVRGRTICLDVYATDSSDRKIDIEVQRSKEGAHVRRARFYSSTIDTRMLKETQDFRELRDSYVIFLTEKDYFDSGLPLYHAERTIKETNAPFGDGSYITYVNGAYKGDDPIGRLVHDFKCRSSKDMYYPELAAGVKQFKETEGGRKKMCEAVEEYGNMRAQLAEAKYVEAIQNLMSTMHWTLSQAMDAMKIPEADRPALIKRLGN
jgi:hypothetical protein